MTVMTLENNFKREKWPQSDESDKDEWDTKLKPKKRDTQND